MQSKDVLETVMDAVDTLLEMHKEGPVDEASLKQARALAAIGLGLQRISARLERLERYRGDARRPASARRDALAAVELIAGLPRLSSRRVVGPGEPQCQSLSG